MIKVAAILLGSLLSVQQVSAAGCDVRDAISERGKVVTTDARISVGSSNGDYACEKYVPLSYEVSAQGLSAVELVNELQTVQSNLQMALYEIVKGDMNCLATEEGMYEHDGKIIALFYASCFAHNSAALNQVRLLPPVIEVGRNSPHTLVIENPVFP